MGRFAMKSRGPGSDEAGELTNEQRAALPPSARWSCLLYTSDAADE